MEIVLGALAGIAGIALLLQSKSPLPSEADYNKAKEKLAVDPSDPDANTVVGKYLCFVLGDYQSGLPFLQRSSDKTLKTLADHEIAPLYADTPIKKIGMGDEWITAAKNFKPLYKIFYDRAAQWYALAWPDLDDVSKTKLRDRFRKTALVPADWAKRGKATDHATGWAGFGDYWGAFVDPTFARSGKTSLKLLGPGKGNETGTSGTHTLTYPAFPGKNYTFSAYVFGDQNDTGGVLELRFIDKAGKYFDGKRIPIPADNPWWQKVEGEMEAPMGAASFDVNVLVYAKNGVVWADDLSVVGDGKQILKNGSLDEK